MQVAWAAVDQLLNELRNIGSSSPFGGEIPNLLFAGNLAGQEKPKKTCTTLDQYTSQTSIRIIRTFWEWFFPTRSFRQQLLAFRNLWRFRASVSGVQAYSATYCLPSKSDSLFGVEDGPLSQVNELTYERSRVVRTSQTSDFIPRAPPYTWSRVTSPTTLEP